jgi:dihydropteroate synthase-like protein
MTTAPRRERIAFVTGKLAAPVVSGTVQQLAQQVGFDAQVVVAKISVAALMTTDWLAGRLHVPAGTDRVILPGMCRGELEPLREALHVPVIRGPDDIRELPQFFSCPRQRPANYGAYDIEILAEINNAEQLTLERLLKESETLRADGADIIDLGCSPGVFWGTIGEAVRELISRGYRVSVDTFDGQEALLAAAAGAELVLSVHEDTCAPACDWGCEVVVIPKRPDEPDWLDSMSRTVAKLERHGVRYRLDPILEPIGCGFARSIDRYLRTREAFPNARMLMGVGNVSELTEADSAGMHALLVGFCQELGITSVLTTRVIHWAAGAVRELAIARQLMKAAVDARSFPKHIDDRLVMLRAGKPIAHGLDELRRLQAQLRDPNFRIFVEDGRLVAMNHEIFAVADDPFELFERLNVTDPSHAFYLGWELMKAATARQLGKRYVQDQALRWGMLTQVEVSRLARQRDRGQP